jgi:hypothetical protein
VAAGGLAVVLAIVGAATFGNNGASPQLQAEAPTAATAPAETSQPLPIDPAASPTPPQGAVPGVAFDQAPATGPLKQDMEIVVKFKDDGKIKDIIDAFWKDPASARAKFDALKAKRPEFAALKLDRVTYSNELVLVHDGGAPADSRLAAMRAAATKLGGAADISYAEPNMTAHPGGQ